MISESFRRAVEDFCKYNLVRLDDIEKKLWPKNLPEDPHDAYAAFRFFFNEHFCDAFSLAVERIDICRRLNKLAQFFRGYISSSPEFWESLEQEINWNLNSDFWFISANFPSLQSYVERVDVIDEGSVVRYSGYERKNIPALRDKVRKLWGAVDEISLDYEYFNARIMAGHYFPYDASERPEDVKNPKGAFEVALREMAENLADHSALEERLSRMAIAQYHFFDRVDRRFNAHAHFMVDGLPIDETLKEIAELYLKGAERFDRKAILIEGKARMCNVLFHPLSLPEAR